MDSDGELVRMMPPSSGAIVPYQEAKHACSVAQAMPYKAVTPVGMVASVQLVPPFD
jgi:hypothetical protein